MFTGIIKEVGKAISLAQGRLTVRAGALAPTLKPGDSLAVSGVCLTLIEVSPPRLVMNVLAETLRVTNLGSLATGAPVNLEPALKIGENLGGHFVTGHVDGVGRLTSRRRVGRDWLYVISLPPELLSGVAKKGSLAVEGVSLTVADLKGDAVSLHLIPYTFTHTNLGDKSPGAMLNIETDLLGKYVARRLAGPPPKSSLTRQFLEETGFM